MECCRSGCENILCQLIFRGRQYICGDCWAEFEIFRGTWPEKLPPGETARRLDAFLDTEAGTYSHAVDVQEEIDRLVRRC